ncbi:MAG: GNAT family N-acetyltransferase [Clostridia bacterium]|nr:GNAT family N-acetyltransferase [Clostridia bacterium]
MIRKATQADIDRVAQIYDDHNSAEVTGKNWSNWRLNLYPVRATAQNALDHGWLWVGEDEKGIFGSYILNKNQAEEYKQIPWHFEAPDDKVMVIHTLCIAPERRGEKKGQEFIEFADGVAKDMGCEVIRIDTWEGNLPAQALYKKMGYELAGGCDFFFANAYMNPLVCLDKKL